MHADRTRPIATQCAPGMQYPRICTAQWNTYLHEHARECMQYAPAVASTIHQHISPHMCADAHKTGVAQEAAQSVSRATKAGMTSQEAHMILGIKPDAPWGEVVKVRTERQRLHGRRLMPHGRCMLHGSECSTSPPMR